MMDVQVQVFVVLYEPRWYGLARWEIRVEEPVDVNAEIVVLERGWMRRKRGSHAVQASVSSPKWRKYYMSYLGGFSDGV